MSEQWVSTSCAASHFCMNGDCFVLPEGTFRCKCRDGFEGDRCQTLQLHIMNTTVSQPGVLAALLIAALILTLGFLLCAYNCCRGKVTEGERQTENGRYRRSKNSRAGLSIDEAG
uniref:probetacellulin-like isoform X1 n=1 Tax=Myxine glutinosa TaxID=7769 RepID=UPI00358FC5C1